VGLDEAATPGAPITLIVHRRDGRTDRVSLTLRLDTRMEIDYVRHGGIMPYVLNELTKDTSAHAA
jgi:aconitate hydratase